MNPSSSSCLCLFLSLRRPSMLSQGWCHPLLLPTWALPGVPHLPPSLYTPHTCALSSWCLVTAPPTAPWPCSTSTPAMKKRCVCVCVWHFGTDIIQQIQLNYNLKEPNLPISYRGWLFYIHIYIYGVLLPLKRHYIHILWKYHSVLMGL